MSKSALIIQMIDLIRRRPGIGVEELAHSIGRSQRTVYRWLAELSSDLRIGIECRDGGYWLRDNSVSVPLGLTPEELLALRLTLKSSLFAEGSPMHKHAQSAWHKIRDAASSKDLASAIGMTGSHVLAPTVLSGDLDPEIVQAVERAVNSRKRLRATYRSQKSDRVKTYTIDPYALAFRRHSWYLLAFSIEHGKVVQLKLVRFKGVEETGEIFDTPAGLSVEDYFRDSWEAWAGGEPVRVRIGFSPRIAQMIAETKRHPTQVVRPQRDGSIIFEVTVSGVEEIAAWVMGFGGEAEALEPEELRSLISERARGMVALYSAVPDPMGRDSGSRPIAERTTAAPKGRAQGRTGRAARSASGSRGR